nr:hypothetical protein ACMD2_04951 [Ipomoea batatas]
MDCLLVVLEDDLDEVAEGGVLHVGGNGNLAGIACWFVRHKVVLEHLVGHFEVFDELEWGVGVLVGHAVDCVSELASLLALGVNQLQCAGNTFGVIRWRWGQFSCSGAFAVSIADESHGGELLLEEPASGYQVVILWILIGCDQNREALSGMEIKGIVIILHGMRALHFHQNHIMTLEPEINGGPHPHIANPEPVGLPSLKGRKWLHLVSNLAVLGVDHQPVRPGNGVAVVKGFLEVLVALVVPVAEEDIELIRGPIEGDGDEFTAVDSEGAVSAGRAVEVGAGEVEVGADLILHLIMIGIVCTGHDGTHGSRHPILPGILPLLNTVPMEQQRLIQFIKHINNNVVVGCAVDRGARQFTVD